MAAKFDLCCTISIATFYVGSWHKMYCCVALPMYLGIWPLIRAKIERNDTCPFQETEHL